MRDNSLSHGPNTDSIRKLPCSVRTQSVALSRLYAPCVLSWLSKQAKVAAKERKERKRRDINCLVLHLLQALRPKTHAAKVMRALYIYGVSMLHLSCIYAASILHLSGFRARFSFNTPGFPREFAERQWPRKKSTANKY